MGSTPAQYCRTAFIECRAITSVRWRVHQKLEELPKVSPAISDGVEHILQLVRPDAEHTDRCRRDVMDAIRMIANLPTYVPPGTVKKQLQDVAVKLKAAHVSINKLPSAWRNLLLANELMRLRGKSEELAGVISTKGRSGGDPSRRTVAFQKQIAAEQAYDLLTDHGGRVATSTRGGEYCRIAALLMEIATGRKSDVERACAQVLRRSD